MKLSYHAMEERIDRLAYIGANIGFGKTIKEWTRYDKTRPTVEELTDTGVLYVKSIDKGLLITAYLISPQALNVAYKGNPPVRLKKRVERNIYHRHQLDLLFENN